MSMSKYTVIHPIKVNGKVIKSGAVDLPADVAEELRASGHVAKNVADVVAEASGAAPPRDDVPPASGADADQTPPPPPPPPPAKKAAAKKAAAKGKAAK